jgi:hypothetical protein
VRRLRILVPAFVVVLACTVASWLAASRRDGACNPNDLTGCDTLGSILLWLSLGLPVVLLALLIFLVFDLTTMVSRRSPSRDDERGVRR